MSQHLHQVSVGRHVYWLTIEEADSFLQTINISAKEKESVLQELREDEP